MEYIHPYVEKVLTGKIKTCKNAILACERAQRDFLNPKEYHYDPEEGERFARFCKHFAVTEGNEHAGKPVILMEWQHFIFSQVLGWKTEKNLRRFREMYVEVPRGNGKSLMASLFSLYLFSADNELGPQIVSASTGAKQARIVFDVAKNMCLNSREFADYLGITPKAHELVLERKINGFTNRGTFKPLAGKGDRMDGLNIHCAIIDELHAIKDKEMWDKITTGAAKRSQSMISVITTAGYNLKGVGFMQTNYCQKVLEGEVDAPSFFGIKWSADKDMDVYSEDTLARVNPAWDKMDRVKVYDQREKAKIVPEERPKYLTLYLNIWQASKEQFFNSIAMDEGCIEYNINDFKHLDCYVTADMAYVDDMAVIACSFWYDGKMFFFPRYFLPETALESNNQLYKKWHEEGWLTIIPGPVISKDYIFNEIEHIHNTFNVRACIIDRAGDMDVSKRLNEAGYETFHAPRGYATSSSTKKLQELILERKFIWHNPILKWNAQNVYANYGYMGDVYLQKNTKGSGDKIDGVMCAIYALDPMQEHLRLDNTMFYFTTGTK